MKADQAAAKSEGNRFKNTDVGVAREGTQIILPGEPFPMRYDEAIECLQRRQKEEETTVSVHETVDTFPFDGAYAFMEAMKQIYGWASPIPTPGFFGPRPPTTLNVEVGFQKFVQVIWGMFKIPGIDGALSTGVASKDGRLIFAIGGEVKKKHQAEVARLAELTREFVRKNSIYRGSAIRLRTDEDGDLDMQNPPSFIDLSRVNEDELTFSDDVRAQVETNLFTPVENTEACRKHKIPLKRGVLLEGRYGTGKTLTAFVTAKKCVENKWTFILIDRVSGLQDALKFARMYQPAVIFAEDVDRAVAGERSVEMDDILNTIDGVESKGSEIITILTSNHVEEINKAMLRPGRLDAVISVHAPDAAAVQKLVKIYARGLLIEGTDLTAVGAELDGQIPAVIREVVERAKLYAIRRSNGQEISLTGEDLTHAARGMKSHLDLMNPTKVEPATLNERLGSAVSEVVRESVYGNGLLTRIEGIKKNVEEIRGRV